VLTAEHPSAQVALASPAVQVLELRITKIDNPARQGVGVRTTLQVTQAGRVARFELGVAAPFPADQPGTFLLPLPRDAQDAVASSPTAAVVDLTLISSAEHESVKEGVVVVIELRARSQVP
jgi:hypothetical protein